MDLVLGLLLRKLLGVVSLQLLEDGVVIEHSIELNLTSWTILVVERPIELLLFGRVNQKVKLRSHDTPNNLLLVHNFYQDCLHRCWAHEAKMLIFPYWLAGLCVLALLSLEYLFSYCHSNRAIHLPKGTSAAGKLSSFEAKVQHIAFFLLESGSQGDKTDLLSIKVEEAPKINLLGLSQHSLPWGRLRAFHLQGIEVGIQINNPIANQRVRADIIVHELDLKAAAIVLEAAIDDEFEDISEVWIFASVLYDCAVPDLIGQFHIDIGVHCEQAASFSFDNCFDQPNLKHTENRFSLLVELHALRV